MELHIPTDSTLIHSDAHIGFQNMLGQNLFLAACYQANSLTPLGGFVRHPRWLMRKESSGC